jgi:hypothetical protein
MARSYRQAAEVASTGGKLDRATPVGCYRFLLARCRAFLNCAYSITSSRSASSKSAVALRTAYARDFGWAWGKKIVIGKPKNWANLSKSEIDRL